MMTMMMIRSDYMEEKLIKRDVQYFKSVLEKYSGDFIASHRYIKK